MYQSSIPSESRPAQGLRRLLGKLTPSQILKAPTYSPEEVRMRLRERELADPRTAAVHAAAARTGRWASLVSDKLAYELGRAAPRLPTVVYWYRQGVPAHEIGRRLSPFGGAWDAERALSVAAALIADSLNQGM
ncbi:MAG: hypothetical protein LC797_19750 [Chloroflexi bacterium]|nr:hypothetical protein [Chloroflexota bacterium]